MTNLGKTPDVKASDELSVTWHSLSAEEVLQKLRTPIDSGLSSEEVARRQEKYGLNQLQERPKRTFFQMVLDQLKSFVVILLIVAAVISAVISVFTHEGLVEPAAIVAIVVLNAILGVVQESRAEAALESLKRMAAPEAQVLRDGHRISIPARELVPGDLVFLEAGNFIPSDMRLLEAVNLKVEEAALTGESVPVDKNATLALDADIPLGDRRNTAFMGTVVSYGRGRGIVTSTGMNTQLGLIATMLQAVEDEETPLQRRLDELGKTLGWACLVICALVFLVGVYRELDVMGFKDLFTTPDGINLIVGLFMVAISLAIAAVPEGLPAIVTISLALGMREMVNRHALIRRLSSVETLGSATVICSDKTGTLTQNEMTVTRIWADGNFVSVSGQGYAPVGDFLVNNKTVNLNDYPAIRTALWVGVINNDAQIEELSNNGSSAYRIIGDPTEGSILVAALKAGAVHSDINKAYPREDEIPFDSDRKRMVTVHAVKEPHTEDISPFTDASGREHYVIAVKGAPDVVLQLCNRYQGIDNTKMHALDEAGRKRILDANDALTKDALRVLGVAYRILPARPEEVSSTEMEKDLVFVGLIGMIDPARPEVAPALHTAATAGIRTIMITGDYPNTARAIAEEIGLMRPGHQVLTGTQLNAMSDDELCRQVEITDVFARVSPEHKMRIVEALRANGEVVAMTGDGVNDAPAIKLADIGVAMGITGTDVAKETADMVLTDDNYASIVSAVEQGRVIYSNIRKFVYFLISCNLAEIMIIFIPAAFGKFLFPNLSTEQLSPLAPIQLLWLNLLTDGAPALALGTEKGDPDIMDQKPRPPKEPIINKTMWSGVIVQTFAITAVTLFAFWRGLQTDFRYAETMAFVTLSASELFRAYTARSERYSIFKIGVFSNKWMNYAVLTSLALMLMVVYVPFFNDAFQTEPLGWSEWLLIIPLLLIPSIAAEITKWVLSRKSQREKEARMANQ